MKVCFLGAGAMGTLMIERLVGEHDVVVFNRTKARAAAALDAGARWAATPREAAAGAQVVISMVRDDEASRSVWLDADDGAVCGLGAGALAIESSTVTPGHASVLDQAVRLAGARFIDAPVVGSTPQARAGALVFLAGGAADDIATAKPLLELMGADVLRAGDVGEGSALKLIVNALFASQVALVGELLGAAGAGDAVRAERFLELLSSLPVMSPAAAVAGRMILARDHAPRFPIELVVKDLRYASSLGDVPLVQAVRERFVQARERGWGREHITAVGKLSSE